MIKTTVVVGPTGVGKSEWAIEYAKKHNGTIINADSQQCYQSCPTLTARPSKEDESQCPHLGYGVLESHVQTTVAWWLQATAEYIKNTPHPIVVGGTGMYIDALLRGLSHIPPIKQNILNQVEEFCQKPAWMLEVKKLDPSLPSTMVDPQRLKRALAVLWQTNQSITEFWKDKTFAVPNIKATVFVLDATMDKLTPRLEKRLMRMMENGAIEEVKSFLNQAPTSYRGLSCALGFQTIIQHLQQQIAFNEMIQKINHDTRLYAKRQRTWFRNRLVSNPLIEHIQRIELL